jgi:tripartite ATP-independent transporter DctP family solute receptor
MTGKKHNRWIAMVSAAVFGITVLSGCGQSGQTANASASEAFTKNAGSDGDVIKLKMAVADAASSAQAEGARCIADEISKATNGKVQVEVIAGGTLGGERDTVELAMLGGIDIVTCANSVLTQWIPEMAILDQAYLFTNEQQAHAAVDGPVGDLIEREALDKLNLHVIGYEESGFRNVFSKKPIESIDDFKGVKIRTMQNPYHMAAFESFGAMPTAMSAGEVFTALQQGTIDACENAISNCYNNGYYEVTKNITYTNHAFVYIIVSMSDHAWKKIPEELRPAVLEGAEKGYKEERELLKQSNDDATVKLKDLGVIFHDIDVNQLQDAYKELCAERGYTFDQEWQAAIDQVIAENP